MLYLMFKYYILCAKLISYYFVFKYKRCCSAVTRGIMAEKSKFSVLLMAKSILSTVGLEDFKMAFIYHLETIFNTHIVNMFRTSKLCQNNGIYRKISFKKSSSLTRSREIMIIVFHV